MNAREEKAADHRKQDGESCSQQLGHRGVRVWIVQRDNADGDREKNDGDEGVGEEPGCLTREVADRLILRDVSAVDHALAKVTPADCGCNRFVLRLSCHVRFD